MSTMTALSPVQRAEADVAYLTELYEGLKDGTRHWTDWCDAFAVPYVVPNRTDIAIDEVYEALRQAQDQLAALRRAA